MKVPKGLAFLIAGQAFGASSILFIQSSSLPAPRLAALRLLVAAVVLGLWRLLFQHSVKIDWGRTLGAAILPGLLLGAHFIAWNVGGRRTPAAMATLVVNLVPVFMPVLGALLVHERPRRREIAGSALAVVGLLVLWGPEALASRPDAAGLLLCFLAVLLSTSYLAFGRKNRNLDLTAYLLGVYAIGSLACLVFDLASGVPWSSPWTGGDWLAVGGLGLVCTLGGHTLNNAALKHYRVAVVAAFTVTQFLWSGGLAYLLWNKVPGPTLGLALIPILAGCALALSRKNPGGP